jgi:hypothetical protein
VARADAGAAKQRVRRGDAGLFFFCGQRVRARFGGGEAWYEGCVAAVCSDGEHLSIRYDDGDAEDAVPKGLVRA